jgi:hypothetical protein
LCASKGTQLKKIIPFIVLWLFLTGSGGYFFAFKLEQYFNHLAIEKKITNRHNNIRQDVLVFTIGNESGLKWIRKQKEFIYQGQMYDIVSTKISGKHVFYYCINDSKEKKIKTDFENKNRANNRANEITRKVIQSYFILPSPSFTVFKQPAIFYFIQPARHYLPPVNKTLSPPPKSIGIA